MNLSDTGKCTFCNEEKETIEHLFFDCIVVSDLWKNFELCLKTKCGLLQINLSKSDILFGNLKFDTVLNQILLCVKIYIFRSKTERSIPTFIGLNKSLSYFYKTEKYIATKDQELISFNLKWNTYKTFIDN